MENQSGKMMVKEFLNYCNKNKKIFLYEASLGKKYKIFRGKVSDVPENIQNCCFVVSVDGGLVLSVHCEWDIVVEPAQESEMSEQD